MADEFLIQNETYKMTKNCLLYRVLSCSL